MHSSPISREAILPDILILGRDKGTVPCPIQMEEITIMKHEHRPTFWGFLFSMKRCWKGLGFRYYTCKYCGKTIQLVKEQRKKYNFLSAIPPIAMVPFFFDWNCNFDTNAPFLFVAVFYGVLYGILCWIPFYIAFCKAKFTSVLCEEGEKSHR